MLGKTEGKSRRRREVEIVSITNSMDVNSSKLWNIVKVRGACPTAVHGVAESDLATEKQKALDRVFPGGSVVKNPLANAGDTGDTGSNPELGRPPRRGNGNPLSILA